MSRHDESGVCPRFCRNENDGIEPTKETQTAD